MGIVTRDEVQEGLAVNMGSDTLHQDAHIIRETPISLAGVMVLEEARYMCMVGA